MSFGQPKDFGASQGFLFIQQTVLIGSNQDAYRSGNTEFHRRGDVPCTNFIHNQKVTLVFVGINDSFTFAKIQASYTHQHANCLAIANRHFFEKLTGFHLFSFVPKFLI